jgi:hypothetical protein
VIIYAQFYIKFRYDKNYTPFLLNISDIIFLNLHQNYHIPGIHDKKLAQQRIESFKVIYRVSSLTYEFEFPNNINIHSIISIIYLKLISKYIDLYNRFCNDYPILIEEDP